jgi:hypothetical protein
MNTDAKVSADYADFHRLNSTGFNLRESEQSADEMFFAQLALRQNKT